MAKVLVTEQYLEDIANAIRTKLNVGTVYTPGQMAAAILSIVSGEGGVDNITYSNGTLSKTINGSTSTVFTADATPTENSTNPVTSGGVYDEIASINEDLTKLDTSWELVKTDTSVVGGTLTIYVNVGKKIGLIKWAGNSNTLSSGEHSFTFPSAYSIVARTLMPLYISATVGYIEVATNNTININTSNTSTWSAGSCLALLS